METTTLSLPDTATRSDAFAERILQSTAGTMDLLTLYLGDRLGLYRALADAPALTSPELAARTGTQERYVREWLEQQCVTGVLDVENPEAPPTERRYTLPAGVDEVLTDEDSLNFLAPMAQLLTGIAATTPVLVETFQTGDGVPFHDFGPDMRHGQARLNRPAFLHELGQAWLPSVPDVHARLQADPPARIADIGCGCGWSSIGMARSYPQVRVDGFDLDTASVDEARVHAREAGLDDRVRFFRRDAATLDAEGSYDLVTAFECIHDLSDPVGVLRAMRRLARPDGAVIVMDERVADAFAPGESDEVEALMYGFSVLHCLPAGMCDDHAAGTGTVMRTHTFRDYAHAAGFREVEILPIENYFFRFYRLHG